MKPIPITWPVLKNHHWVIMVNTYVQQKNRLGGIIDLDSRVIGFVTNTNSEKLTLGSRVGFDSRAKSKSNNWTSHSFPFNGMWLFKIGNSISRSMGTEINIGSKNWSKLGEDTGINIDSKMET